ncbi:beta-1,3-glucan-binding protein-like [Diabrotica undecimpunctata]|uniref:beta-1,3-glucan-binding protein-like n=1 Tax=Diabrotica undecimpunctata TaxID=50387 RepID=UPI003B632B09
MWLKWIVFCGTIFLSVIAQRTSWRKYNYPQTRTSPERAQELYRNYYRSNGQRADGQKYNGNPVTFFGTDREQAQRLFKQFQNSISEYQQKNGGNGEIKVLNPSNIVDLAKIFTKNVETQNPNSNFLPIVKVRYEDGSEDPENIIEIIPNTRNSADLNQALVNLWNITAPNNTNIPLPTPPSESTGNDESSEDDSTITSTTTSEKPLSKPKPAWKPKPNKNNKDCPKSKTYVEGEKQCKGKLIFSEDFSSLKRHVWNVEHIFAAAPDYEFTIYVNRPDVYSITNNYMQLAPARTEDIFGPTVLGDDGSLDLDRECTGRAGPPDCKMTNAGGFIVPLYSSFRINTKNKFSFKYGIVEIRAKLPEGDWLYPILYLNPSAETYGKHYASGQMRIAYIEGNDDANNILKGGVILGDSEPARNYYMMNITRENSWADTFHKYRLEWRPDSITLSVDNKVYGKIEPPEGGFLSKASELQIRNSEDWRQGAKLAPFDKEMYLQIGVGIGGLNFPDRSDRHKPWRNRERLMVKKFYEAHNEWLPTWDEGKSALKIDYIKVWAL